jgi:serine-type D-Ala-D-Ala carboxypeptidase/endopeptidase (penicillin-binding protein 4)
MGARKIRRRFIHIAGTLALALTGGSNAFALSAAATVVTRAAAAQHLPESAASFAIVDPDSGRVLAELNGEEQRSPASTIKLVTTFASLDLLGPAFVWHTRALIRGDLKNGVLDGDLILQGGGDPYITLERWWSFVRDLRAKGLKSIRGDIVIDDSAFALPPEDPGAFDGRPNRTYNVQPDALMVNFQSIEFRVVPNRDTRKIDIVATPAPANLAIENRIDFAAGGCSASAAQVGFEVVSERWDRVLFTGALSPRCAERSITRVLLTPTAYAYGTFIELWQELGGEFTGKLRVEAAASDAQPLLDFESLSLAEIVRLTNKFSSNLMARHLLLTVGEARYGAPATLEKGADAIVEWGRQRGLALQDIDIDNGSGLSRATHISALQMAKVLAAAYHSRYAPEFIASLPLAGIDGTLRSRMRDTPAGSVRLKTGHIDAVANVAGYVTTLSGKTFVLVSFINHARANDGGAGDRVHAALVTWLQDNL